MKQLCYECICICNIIDLDQTYIHLIDMTKLMGFTYKFREVLFVIIVCIQLWISTFCPFRDAVEGIDPIRREKLIELLDIDLRWRMHKVSDGQRRRVQICMGLLHPFQVILLLLGCGPR